MDKRRRLRLDLVVNMAERELRQMNCVTLNIGGRSHPNHFSSFV